MLKNITFKREYLLIGGAVLLLIAAYCLAFRKTIEQWHVHTELEAKLDGSNNSAYQPDYLQRKNANLNKIIRLYQADTSVFRTNSVNAVSLIAQRNSTSLVNIPYQDTQPDTGKMITEEMTLAGNYFSLLKTSAGINNTRGIGWLRSMSIERLKLSDGTADTKKLKMELYVEIIK